MNKAVENLNLAIVCGGTGGHFYPGLTIARKHVENGGNCRLFLCGKHSESQSGTAASFGLESIILPNSVAPAGLTGKISFIFYTLRGILFSRKELKRINADAVLAMGSFTSAATVLAAKSLGIPVFLHDGNARVGKANIFLSKWAKHMGIAFPPANAEPLKCQYTVTGMPVRPELLECKLTKTEAIKIINEKHKTDFNPEKPLMMITGGSQGALTLNRIIPEAVKAIAGKELQIIHLAGPDNSEEVLKIYSDTDHHSLVLDSCNDMNLLYTASDLVICRSGGSTIAELAIFANYAILIPLPHAADNHQQDNAEYYASSGAAVIVKDSDCDVEKNKTDSGKLSR